MPNIDEQGRISLNNKQRETVARRVKAAREWREDVVEEITGPDRNTFDTRSERNLSLVRGTYWHERGMDNVISINHIAKGLGVKQAIICGGKTAFLVAPRQQQFDQVSDIAKPALNHLWGVLGLDAECDKARWDSGIFPTGGVVEVGWQYRDRNIESEGHRPSELEIAEAELDNPDSDAVDITLEMADQAAMQGYEPTEEELEQAALTQAANVEPEVDDPFIERFDPRDFYVDPACTSPTLTDARYAFRRKYLLVDECKQNRRWRNTSKVKGAVYSYQRGRDTQEKVAQYTEDDQKRVELFDGYCFLSLGRATEGDELYHIVWCSEIEMEFLCEPCGYKFDALHAQSRLPYEVMPPTVTDNDSLSQTTDVERARDTQVAHDLAYTRIEWSRSHAQNVLLTAKGMFDGEDGEETKERIEEGHENAVLQVDPAFMQFVKWMERPPLHSEDYQALESTPGLVLDIIGVSEYQASQVPDKRMTATEANLAGSQGNTRQDAEVEAYFDFIERCAYKLLVLLQQYQDRARGYASEGAGGQKEWGAYNMVDLRGGFEGEPGMGELYEPGIQFSIEVDAAKKLPKNEFTERKDAVELLGALQPYAQMPDPRLPNRPLVNLPVLIRGLVDKYDLPNADEIVPPPPTEEEQATFQQQQAEQAAMAAQQEAQQSESSRQSEDGKMMNENQNRQADREHQVELARMKGGI